MLNDDETGFSSPLYTHKDGSLVLVLPGSKDSKDSKDLKDNLSILTGSNTPRQVESALEAYRAASALANKNGLKLEVVGFSIGGYLAQLFPDSVNFSGPGAGKVYDQLIKDGIYDQKGISPEGQRIHIGSHRDPVYNLVGTDSDLNRKLDISSTPSSPHVVSGENGNIFYLAPTISQDDGLVHTNEHFRNWDSLANNNNVVRTEDTTFDFEASMNRTIPWLAPAEDPPLVEQPLSPGTPAFRIKLL